MKTKMQHTPGPWTAEYAMERMGGYEARVMGSGNYRTALVYAMSQDEAEANARLIAAAPDLLEAANRALAGFYVNGECVEFSVNGQCAACDSARALRAAIAKAEGKEAV